MSDMKTIMENFRQFERNEMENKIEKLLKENKNLKKRLNAARKLHESPMAGVGMGLKVGAATAVGKAAADKQKERARIGEALRKVWESIPCDIEDELATVPIELEPGDIVLGSVQDMIGPTYTVAFRQVRELRLEIIGALVGDEQTHRGRGHGLGPFTYDDLVGKTNVSSGSAALSAIEDKTGVWSLVGAINGVPGCELKAAFDRAARRFGSPTPSAGVPPLPRRRKSGI